MILGFYDVIAAFIFDMASVVVVFDVVVAVVNFGVVKVVVVVTLVL